MMPRLRDADCPRTTFDEGGRRLAFVRDFAAPKNDPEFLQTLLARRILASLTFDTPPSTRPRQPEIHSIPIESGPAQFNLILSAMLRPGSL